MKPKTKGYHSYKGNKDYYWCTASLVIVAIVTVLICLQANRPVKTDRPANIQAVATSSVRELHASVYQQLVEISDGKGVG